MNLDFKKNSVTGEAFDNTQKYRNEFGDLTLVLTEIGGFYEVYDLESVTSENFKSSVNIDNLVNISKIIEYSKICDLDITHKSTFVNDLSTGQEYRVVFAGFPEYKLNYYIKLLENSGYTLVIIKQDRPGAGSTRSLAHIYSPGCYFYEESMNEIEKISNTSVCIWIEINSGQLFIGLASIDIYSGQSYIFQYVVENKICPGTFDEIQRFLLIKNPKEILFISPFDELTLNKIIKYVNLETKLVHKISLTDKKIKNCIKQSYQKKIFLKFFSVDNFYIFVENSIASQAYAYLLEFLNDHNSSLIKKIKKPVFENSLSRVVLSNYSLKQLEIVGDKKSLCNMLNDCVTPMGKRYFIEKLTNPTIDQIYLNKEYNIIEHIISMNTELRNNIVLTLKKINDLDKLIRFVVNKKITPRNIYHIFSILKNTLGVIKLIKHDLVIKEYLNSYPKQTIIKLMNYFLENFNLENCSDCKNKKNITYKIFNSCHEKIEIFDENKTILEKVCQFLNSLVGKDFVKIKETDKAILSLVCTKSRIDILKNAISKVENDEIKITPYFNLQIKEICFKKHLENEYFIQNEQLLDLSKTNISLKKEINDYVVELYAEYENTLIDFVEDLTSISEFIKILDFIFCKALIAIKFNYTKPQIEASENSFINATNLRHNLVEYFNINEFYTPNNISLNSKGLLIYGCNSSGKSVFIKSIGINIILAQAGFYVAASNFKYYPYSNIFTRILSNDNIFEGFSKFAIEMMELEIILKLSNANSLIIADELTAGSEIASGTSILISTLQILCQRKATFVFSTHIHQLINYEEISSLINNNLILVKHLSAYFDIEKNKLIYVRKLEDGPGAGIYGLELCKSIKMPLEFLNKAELVRNKYFTLSNSILSQETTKYNSSKIVGICEKCNQKISTEVHHIWHQKNADKNGFITTPDGLTFHKNHPANLLAVCEECHNSYHS